MFDIEFDYPHFDFDPIDHDMDDYPHMTALESEQQIAHERALGLEIDDLPF